MTLSSLLANVLGALFGFVVAWCLLRRGGLGGANGSRVLAALALGPGLGFGTLSFAFFTFVHLTDRNPGRWGVLGIMALTCIGAWWLGGRRVVKPWKQDSAAPRTGSQDRWIALLLVLLALATAMAGVVYCSWAEPEGRHDAIALWNVRARQLFLAGQEHAALFRRSSWICDYPLMLPSGNAALFTIAGEASFAVTRGTAIEFFLGVPLLGAFLLRQVGLGAWSSFFAVLLLSTPIYWLHGQSQYADIPLAYFVLGAAGVLASALQADEGRRLPLTLAGFFLGCAAWTKNEGALLALVLVMAFTVTLLASPALRGSIGRSLASLALGALVPILDMVAFKRSWAQDTGFSRLVEVTYQDNLRSADRWMGSLIGYGAEMTSWKNWGLTWIVIAICLLTGLVSAPWRRVPLLRFGGLGIVGCAFAWYMVYVLTPFDQKWHIDTSLHRLLLQLQPVLTFVALVYYGSDRDLTSREPRAALTGS